MRLWKIGLPLAVGALVLAVTYRPGPADTATPPKRIPWTTSKVKGTPEPPPPYRLEVVFPKVKFFEPLEVTAAAGSERLFVATRPGKLFSFVADAKTEPADLLL